MNRFLTPLEVLNLHFSNGASLGNHGNTLWRRVNSLLTWENIIERNYQADLAPFLYYIITKALPGMAATAIGHTPIEDLVPPNVVPFLTARYQANLFRNIVLLEETKRITRALDENGITCIPLKGAYLAENVYEDIACRPMGDLDLLVRERDREAAYGIMTGLGYEILPGACRDESMHRRFSARRPSETIPIEVHHCLVKPVFKKRFDLQHIFDVGYIPIELQLAYLAWHATRHGISRIIWLCDIGKLAASHGDRIRWEQLGQVMSACNVRGEVTFVTYLCEALLMSQFPVYSRISRLPHFRRLILARLYLMNQQSMQQRQDRWRHMLSLHLMSYKGMIQFLPRYLVKDPGSR